MLLFPDLPSLKLVEPGRDEGVVRVETMVRVSGVLGSGSGYRVPVVVSTQPFASLTCWLNQLQERFRLGCSFFAVRLNRLSGKDAHCFSWSSVYSVPSGSVKCTLPPQS